MSAYEGSKMQEAAEDRRLAGGRVLNRQECEEASREVTKVDLDGRAELVELEVGDVFSTRSRLEVVSVDRKAGTITIRKTK